MVASLTAKLSWSGPATPKQIVPQSQLYAGAPTTFAVKINFQPADSPVRPGTKGTTARVRGPR